jgi:hypothetical protein
MVSSAVLPGVGGKELLKSGTLIPVMSNIVGVEPAKVAIGVPLRVTFDDVKEGLSIPKFTAA